MLLLAAKVGDGHVTADKPASASVMLIVQGCAVVLVTVRVKTMVPPSTARGYALLNMRPDVAATSVTPMTPDLTSFKPPSDETASLLVVTVVVAVAVTLPLVMSPPVVVTVLLLTPTTVPLTLRENVQLLPVGNTPPVKLTAEPPAVAVIVPPPGQLVMDKPLGDATTNPAGKASVNANPLMDVPASPPLAVKVKVKLVLPFSPT